MPRKRKNPKTVKVEDNIYDNGYHLIVKLTSDGIHYKSPPFPRDGVADARLWRDRKMREVEHHRIPAGATLIAGMAEYLRPGGPARLTKANRKRRTQQLEWWCAQLAAMDAPVLPWKLVKEEKAARLGGEHVPYRGKTLGECFRSTEIEAARLSQILNTAFPTPEDDPAKYAATYNHYRLALWHLYVILDQENEYAANPVRHVEIRQGADAGEHGLDMRLVRGILEHAAKKSVQGGKPGLATRRRAEVLAWVHIRPTQLMKVDPLLHFRDLPNATREDILDGLVTVIVQPHLKGRKKKRLPAPEDLPLNPWGVEAMRAFAACPEAHGKFSMASANKYIQRGAARFQEALRQQGYHIDLSKFTLRHLKHSLASAADVATNGMMNRKTGLQIDEGVVGALGHSKARTTLIYTQVAVKPKVRRANELTTLYLEWLLKQPLVPAPTPLRIVRAK
jgi:hypothetical protein